jgi:DNA-directed RNA polymerase specialized sigma24 family protein
VATFSAITSDFFSTPSFPQTVEPKGLLARAKVGDTSAFRGLFEEHSKPVYSLSLRIASGVPEAETLTRDIFLAAFSKLESLTDERDFARELYRHLTKNILVRRG